MQSNVSLIEYKTMMDKALCRCESILVNKEKK